ncbi:unknown [Odoribacter laneus CAG:561]|nr:unknown [Odoribacter laneus CAG:561]
MKGYLEEFLFFAKKVRPSGGIRKVYFSLLPAAKEEKAENSNKSVDQENFKTEAVAV